MPPGRGSLRGAAATPRHTHRGLKLILSRFRRLAAAGQGSQGGFPLAASPHGRPSESPLPWLPCPSLFLKDTGQVGLGPTRQVSFELNHLFKALYLQTQARSEGPGFRTLAPEFRGSLFRP